MADQPTGNIRRDAALALTLVAAVTLLLHLVGAGFWLQGFFAIATFTFLPGAAILTLLPPLSLPARIGLAAALSMAATAIYAYVLIILHAYYPQIIIWTLYPLAGVLLLARAAPTRSGSLGKRSRERLHAARERIGGDRTAMFCIAGTLLALLLWLAGAFSTDTSVLGGLGLITALPLTWKVGWAIALLSALIYATTREPLWWVLAALVAAPIAMFYLTPVIVYQIPHLPWNYKHIGVTELLLQLHHTRPNLDIYNRWPSFFGAAGVFTRLGDFENPVQFVKWAEVYFISIQSVLVSAIALSHTRRRGVAAVAVLLFFAIDWIGQVYFAPQAMGFTLMLATLLIFWQFLYAGGNRLGGVLASIGGFIVRRKQEWETERPGEWPRALAAVVMLLVVTGIVLVHQLTPYVLLLQLGALWMFGYIRPRWAFWGAAAITILYLLPQLTWVNDHFGLFSSLNPLDNAKNEQTQDFICGRDCLIVQGSARVATLVAWLLAGISILVLGRRRPKTRIAALTICFMAPFITLFGQNYGGEAALRVVLFGSPFTALLIALAISTINSQRLRRAVSIVVVMALSVGLFVAYFGLEGVEYLSRSDLDAANYVASHAPAGSVLISSGAQTVSHQSANYGNFYDVETIASLLGPKYQTKPYSQAALRDLIVMLSSYHGRIFLGFSPRNDRFNEITGQFREGFVEQLRRQMLQTPYFRLWKRIGDNVIIEWVPRDQQPRQRR